MSSQAKKNLRRGEVSLWFLGLFAIGIPYHVHGEVKQLAPPWTLSKVLNSKILGECINGATELGMEQSKLRESDSDLKPLSEDSQGYPKVLLKIGCGNKDDIIIFGFNDKKPLLDMVAIQHTYTSKDESVEVIRDFLQRWGAPTNYLREDQKGHILNVLVWKGKKEITRALSYVSGEVADKGASSGDHRITDATLLVRVAIPGTSESSLLHPLKEKDSKKSGEVKKFVSALLSDNSH
jgi:hypothetical protein